MIDLISNYSKSLLEHGEEVILSSFDEIIIYLALLLVGHRHVVLYLLEGVLLEVDLLVRTLSLVVFVGNEAFHFVTEQFYLRNRD
jgi:hypothetical protein